MKPDPRWYQREAIARTFKAWDDAIQRPALVLPCGAGKTIILSEVAVRLVREHGRRPVILVHTDELVEQTVRKLRACDPGLSIGIIKAERQETHADICVASVQTLSRRLCGKRRIEASRFTDIICDEAHHAAARSYVSIFEYFGAMDPASGSRALGVSATLSRSDGTPLGHIWEACVFELSIQQAMEEGWLVPAHAERVVLADLDLSKVKSIAGDWSVEDLGGKMFKSGAAICEVLLEKGLDDAGRVRRTIVFAPTVLCANLWAADFNVMGVRTKVVVGTTPKVERDAIYEAVELGRLDAIVGVNVLVEGFDLPAIEVAVMGRPTKSKELFTQAVGRAFRPSALTGKSSALVIDVVGTMTDKLVTLVDLAVPHPCTCDCDCDWEHLCPQACACPRSRKGKLKLPCIVCAKVWMTQIRADREPCYHYEDGHVVGCLHRCEGLGRPGIHDEDDDQLILDPLLPEPEPIVIDSSEITTERVELFERTGTRYEIRYAPKPVPKPRAWQQTLQGRHFLPPTSTFDFVVFLHLEQDGTWTVGERPMKGRGPAKRLGNFATIGEAIVAANEAHPSGGKAPKLLVGLPSEAQAAYATRLGCPLPVNPTRDQVSKLISVYRVSQMLD